MSQVLKEMPSWAEDVLKEMPSWAEDVDSLGRPAKYLWRDWLDGETHLLVRASDGLDGDYLSLGRVDDRGLHHLDLCPVSRWHLADECLAIRFADCRRRGRGNIPG